MATRTFYATFPSGFQEVARDALARALPDADAVETLDGALIFRSGQSLSRIRSLQFVHNSFVLVQRFAPGRGSVAGMLAAVAGGSGRQQRTADRTPGRQRSPDAERARSGGRRGAHQPRSAHPLRGGRQDRDVSRGTGGRGGRRGRNERDAPNRAGRHDSGRRQAGGKHSYRTSHDQRHEARHGARGATRDDRDTSTRRPALAGAPAPSAADTTLLRRLRPLLRGGTLRLVTADGNRLVGVDSALRDRAERVVAEATQTEIHRAGAEHELWFAARRDGTGFILLRLTTHAGERNPAPGELRPEVAHLLCSMTAPARADVVLDPFCGRGAILAARVRHFPCAHALGLDLDRALVAAAHAALGKAVADMPGHAPPPAISVRVGDATDLRGVTDHSVDTVITDPPWGRYRPAASGGGDRASRDREAGTDRADEQAYRDLHWRFHAALPRVLRPGARVVLLLGRHNPLPAAATGLLVTQRHEVLISGQKAVAVRLDMHPAAG